MEGLNVEDPIGLILGGRFVGRRRELAELTNLLAAEAPEAPTALVVSGIPGSGKSSLLAQLADHALSAGMKVDWIASMDGVVGTIPPSLLETVTGKWASPPASISTTNLERLGVQDRRLLVLDGNPVLEADYTAAIRLSRLLWAGAQERGKSSGIVIAVGVSTPGEVSEPHVHSLALPPFDSEECRDFVRGMLGSGEYPTSFIKTLWEVTGGWPLPLTDALFNLVSNRLVVRRDGHWGAGETAREAEIRAAASGTHWALLWNTLTPENHGVLARLAAFPQGIPVAGLSQIVRDQSPAYLDYLESRGWVRRIGDHVGFGSEAARSAVTQLCPGELLMNARRDVLRRASGDLDPEVAAEIRLEIDPSPETVGDVAEAARSAVRRGATDIGIQRYQRCLEAIARIRSPMPDEAIRVELAECLVRQGKPDIALDVLLPLTTGEAGASNGAEAARALRVAGAARIARGEHAMGESLLRQGITIARTTGKATEGLRARAALAELAWTYGTAEDRAATIAEISEVLSAPESGGAVADVRAELAYSLGSALSRAGHRSDGRGILEAAYGRPCSEYWKMRIANALVAVEYFTSRYDQALVWSERALQHADRTGSDDMRPRILGNRAGVYYARGQLRESTEQDRMVLHWARRIGSLFELASANSNFAVDKFLRAEYAEAQAMARETVRLAELMRDRRYGAKGRETDALCYLMIGRFEDALGLVQEAKELLSSDEYVGLKPRLDWLEARVRIALRDEDGARELLDRAENALISTDDWEDLWGIQVERCLLDATAKEADRAISSILEIVAKAENAGLYLVSYLAIGAAAQVALVHRMPHAGAARLARSILPRSEEAGLDEVTWTLSLLVGTSDLEGGDAKAAHSRFAHALRIIRRIADSLPVDHRRSYLETPRVRTALDRMK
ncbi:MAG TPA: AAA family ATPase [Acidobacteriota bacterium]|nr:AAA family ATPase [Acidobacteriota bacterium]